jgi:hypothetical protein
MKKYILWVKTKHEDESYSTRWYGWSQNLTLTYDEALKEKEKIQDKFYDVKIKEFNG